jgi:ComF family protein
LTPSIKLVRALFRFHGSGKELIHKWKYGTNFFIKDLWQKQIKKNFPFGREDFSGIVPVPAHFAKVVSRGFNQSFEIAKIISRNFNKKIYANNIVRKKYTKAQSLFEDFENRKNNVKNAFKVKRSFTAKSILIVDDIITSGSTVNELAESILSVNRDITFKIFTLAYAI